MTIPKGVNVEDGGLDDYTQYRAVIDTSNKIYYFNPYDTNNIFAVKLTEDLLNAEDPTEIDSINWVNSVRFLSQYSSNFSCSMPFSIS